MSTRLRLRDWRPGQPLGASHFQEAVAGLRELRAELDELRRRIDGLDASEATSRSDETEAEQQDGTLRWKFIDSTTETERLEDADDSDVYIDVQRTTSITVQKPSGEFLVIEFE